MNTAIQQTQENSNVAPLSKAVEASPVQINYLEMEEVDAHVCFPELFAKGELQLKRRKHRHPDCIPSNQWYIPDAKTLRRVLAWWYAPQLQPLGLTGETGTGKSEMLLYVADRLNEPAYVVQVHQAMQPEDLSGSKELVESDSGVVTKNKLGLAAKAYKDGGLVIFDELDKGNIALHSAMHGLVEGKPWPLEQFGLILSKHPSCRITATANTTGEGGHERYSTSQRMDAALRSRFGWLKTFYLAPEDELNMLDRRFPKLPLAMKRDMVNLANALRDACLGQDRTGEQPGTINAPFSTRTSVCWAHNTMVFGLNATWREALDFAYDGSVDADSKSEVKAIIQRIFMDTIDKTVKEVIQSYLPKK